MPFAPALAHVDSLGLVYDFLIDSSAFLSAELPAGQKKKEEVSRRKGWKSMFEEVINLLTSSMSYHGFGGTKLSHFFF